MIDDFDIAKAAKSGNDELCFRCARQNGHMRDCSEGCKLGELECKGCPFRRREK